MCNSRVLVSNDVPSCCGVALLLDGRSLTMKADGNDLLPSPTILREINFVGGGDCVGGASPRCLNRCGLRDSSRLIFQVGGSIASR